MNLETLNRISEKLKNYEWVLFSGVAVEIYSNGKRKSGDFDIAVKEKALDEIAELFGTKAKKRKIRKEDYQSDDRGFVTIFNKKEIEITSGFPKKRIKEKKFDKLFDKKVIKRYKGLEIPLVPFEELIVHKADMYRKKDISDLRLLKSKSFDKKFVKELAEDIGKKSLIIKRLNDLGYEL